VDQDLRAAASRPDAYAGLSHQTIGIVDANAILSSVDNDCRKGWDSRLLRSTLFGCTTLYAADHVWREVYDKLPKIAKSSPVPLADLRARFEAEYLPAIRFVTMSAEHEPHPRVLEITDLDDRPTGQLALLLGPVIVYSEDRDLRRPGFAPPDWRTAAGYTADVAEAAGQERATGTVLVLPVAGMCSGSGALARRLGVPAWLPGVAFVALLGLGAYRLLLDPVRRAAAKDVGGKFAEGFLMLLAEQNPLKLDGLAGISRVIFSPALNEPTIRQQVAITLARCPEAALLAGEVRDLVVDNFGDYPVPSVQEVRNTLTEGSEFFRVDRSRWQLGRQAAPWSGQYS
jgi:hypothetical protein